jgi:hypothetical protein
MKPGRGRLLQGFSLVVFVPFVVEEKAFVVSDGVHHEEHEGHEESRLMVLCRCPSWETEMRTSREREKVCADGL